MSNKNMTLANYQATKKEETKQELEGKTFYTYYGTPFIVTEYNGSTDIRIVFPFSGIEQRITLNTIKNSNRKTMDPFYRQNGAQKPFVFKNKEDEFVGRQYINMSGDPFKIIAYRNYMDIDVQFLVEPYYIREHVTIKIAELGNVKNPYHKNLSGGYIGENREFASKEYLWLNQIWDSLIIRGHDHERFKKLNQKYKNPNYSSDTYDNTFVAEEWFEYPVFARDYLAKLSQLNPNVKYEIDKDLLYPFYKDKTNGMTCYSNETTVLLPAEINISFLPLNPYKKCIRIRTNKKTGSQHIEYQYYKVDNFINSLENYWKEKFQYYLSIGALLPEIYNLLENLRIEKIRLIQENNPWYLERKNK